MDAASLNKKSRHACPALGESATKVIKVELPLEGAHLKEADKHEQRHVEALKHNGAKQLRAKEPRAQDAQSLADEP